MNRDPGRNSLLPAARRLRRRAALAAGMAVLFACACLWPADAPARQDEGWRKQAPRAASSRPLRLPEGREARLANGLTLALVEDRRAPLVTFHLAVPLGLSGRGAELARQFALREAVAELLIRGAAGRSGNEIAREVETLGGSLSSSAGDDNVEVVASVIAENAGRVLEILGDVVLRPDFPAEEVALYKENRVQNLAVSRQDPAFLVSEEFNRIVYGAHPYGVSAPTRRAVAGVTRAALRRFYAAHYRPDGAVLVLVGDFDAAAMEERARAVFGGWRGRRTAGRTAPAVVWPRAAARRVHLVNRPGSEQADFRIGNPAVARQDADYFPLLVANAILGAGTSSRLFLNIREQKGYAYDVFSVVGAQRRAGTFFVEAQTRSEVAAGAITAALAEVKKLGDAGVTEAELQNAKNLLRGTVSLTLATQGGLADQLADAYLLNGQGTSYLKEYLARIDAVTAAAVQAAARRYLRADRAVVVVVGDAARLRRPLATIGPLTVKGANR